jgi:hypothetical protein
VKNYPSKELSGEELSWRRILRQRIFRRRMFREPMPSFGLFMRVHRQLTAYNPLQGHIAVGKLTANNSPHESIKNFRYSTAKQVHRKIFMTKQVQRNQFTTEHYTALFKVAQFTGKQFNTYKFTAKNSLQTIYHNKMKVNYKSSSQQGN